MKHCILLQTEAIKREKHEMLKNSLKFYQHEEVGDQLKLVFIWYGLEKIYQNKKLKEDVPVRYLNYIFKAELSSPKF